MDEVVPVVDQAKLLDLTRALEQVPALVEAKVMRGAMRKGMKLIADAVRDSYPSRTGKLKESVRLRSSRRGKTIRVMVTVGERLKRLRPGEAKPELAWYAHIAEFGAGTHVIRPRTARALQLAPNLYLKGAVTHPGITGRGYLRRAFDRRSGDAVKAFAAEFERLLERELKKLPAARRM